MIDKEISTYLDNLLKDFFPKEGEWSSNCFRRNNFVHDVNLPCHLRNIDWLTSLIMKKYDLSLKEDTIKEYVKNSMYFNKLRSEYEQRIIKWQINWMKNGGEGWIVADKSGGDFYEFSPKCDYIFRKGIVDTLQAIGMDIDAIEEGIEKNANIWRDKYMNLAFSNEFDPVFYTYSFRLSPLNDSIEAEDNEILKESEFEFRKQWLKYRKYQYYQEHKKSVDMYSNKTTEMMMTKEEAKKLELYLEENSLKRHKEIAEFKKNREKKFKAKEIKQQVSYQVDCQNTISDESEKNLLKRLVKKIGIIK